MSDIAEWLLARIADDRAAALAVRWDPARVLAECEAKKAIIKKAAGWIAADAGMPHQTALRLAGQDILELLALPYADRPGYRKEWRP